MKSSANNQGSWDHNGSPSESWSDAELVRHLKAHRDERSFELLYARYCIRLRNCAWKVLHDGQLAGDVAQEILLKLWKHPDKMAGERSPRGLLCKMAHDLAVDLANRERRFEPMGLDLERWLGNAADASVKPLERAEFWAEVRSCLTPARFRIVVRLYAQDLSINECAEKERVTAGTVKRIDHDLLEKLKKSKFLSTFLPSHSDTTM